MNIKVSLLKTNKQNKLSVKLMPIGELMESLRTDNQYGDKEALRNFARHADHHATFKNMHRLPVVCPAAEMHIDDDGNRLMRQFNGLITLTIGPLSADEDLPRVKKAVAMLPMTVAAIAGSSGRTVKVIAAISRADGELPQTDDEAERLCQQACPLLCNLYQVVVDMISSSQTVSVAPALRRDDSQLLHTGFRMTLDKEPLLLPQPTPLRISDVLPMMPTATVTAAGETGNEGQAISAVSTATQQLIRLLTSRYDFRYNRIMGYTEYRSKKKSYYGWMPVDEQMMNSLSMEARLAGLNVWDKDVKRYLRSNLVPAYDPIEEYLWDLHGKWDGEDHIGRLAARVPTRQKHWPQWFRTWLLAMVAQWLHRNPRYGNAMAPLLISTQGYNKSTFCRSLIPPELQWGYNDNLVLSEKKQVLQAMSQFLLINLDEFNQISPRVQEGFLKNLIQLASVKVKRPYAKHVEEFPRLASFIATANVNDILSDPSGNRRFIGVELTGPIDVSQPVNHRQLYAQALALLEQGEPYWLDEEQTREVMTSNQQFQLRSTEELYFYERFRLPEHDGEGEWLTAAAIFDEIRSHAGSTALRSGSLIRFSRILANIPGIQRRRTHSSTAYLICRK